MTRRELIRAMATAAVIGGRLRSQHLTLLGAGAAGSPPIPSGPVGRWNFSSLGLTEGATITNVPDISGNGNDLGIDQSQPATARAPKFTLLAINGVGAFNPGSIGGSTGTDDSFILGALATAGNIPSLTENSFSILYCAQFGGPGGLNGLAMASVGGLDWWQRLQNSTWPANQLWRNFTPAHGDLGNIIAGPEFCGPVAGAIINGYGGVGTQTKKTANRTSPAPYTNQNWAATTLNAPVHIGWSANATTSTSKVVPYGCLWHEFVVYNRVLTDAEILMWRVYCNARYKAPLDANITKRLLWIGDSVTESMGSTYGRSLPNRVAGALNNFNVCEHINYGVGGAQVSDLITNESNFTGLFDGTLAKNVAIVHSMGNNDIVTGAKTASQIYGVDNTSGIWKLVADLKAAGFTVGVSTLGWNNGLTSPQNTTRGTLNGLITGNAAGADFVIDGTVANSALTSTFGPGTSVDSVLIAQNQFHPNDTGYLAWALVITAALAGVL